MFARKILSMPDPFDPDSNRIKVLKEKTAAMDTYDICMDGSFEKTGMILKVTSPHNDDLFADISGQRKSFEDANLKSSVGGRWTKFKYAFANLDVGGVIANDVPTFRVDYMP